MARPRGKTLGQRWRDMKQKGDRNTTLDQLMNMVGLEEVEAKFLEIKEAIELEKKLYGLQNDRQTTVLLGNPGTGKTTVARLYSNLLSSLKIFGPSRRWAYKEISGSLLASKSIPEVEQLIAEITANNVGAVFIDETYQLVNRNTSGGRIVLDYILAVMEEVKDRVVFIFAEYKTDMEMFYMHNQGLASRIAYTFKSLQNQIVARYGGQMKIATCPLQKGDPNFLMKVVARRISQGRNREGFGNVRAVESVVAQIHSRLCNRLNRELQSFGSFFNASSPQVPDFFLLTDDDMLGGGYGPKFNSKALNQLDEMIGLEEVKKSVRGMIKKININRTCELMDLPPLQESLNKVFLGNPGTGKTTVAKLYGQILVELEKATKAILASTKGKVLAIDEAYGLGNRYGAKGTPGIKDPFRSDVIDTLVADKMEEKYRDANPGFKRRFPLDSAFVFEDFTNDQLRQIWKHKVKARGLNVDKGLEDLGMEIIERKRHRLRFGNAGEVDIILDAGQKRYQERMKENPSTLDLSVDLQPADIDTEFQRLTKAAQDVKKLFKGVIGCDKIKKTTSSWPRKLMNAKKAKIDIYEIFPIAFTFFGPPGTGKTTTAKNIGTIMYCLGLLASNEVDVISASELMGEYIGQTGPKTRAQFEASLGKVLFIDEAYRLCNGSYFGQDAIDEIVTSLTEDKFKNYLVVILAGCDHHMRYLLNQNPGLASRVPGKLVFPPLAAQDAIALLDLHLNKNVFRFKGLKDGKAARITSAMQSLVQLDNWANGRSVENLSWRIKSSTLDEDHSGPLFYIMREELPKLSKTAGMSLFKPKSKSHRAAMDTMKSSAPPPQTKEKIREASPQKTVYNEDNLDPKSTTPSMSAVANTESVEPSGAPSAFGDPQHRQSDTVIADGSRCCPGCAGTRERERQKKKLQGQEQQDRNMVEKKAEAQRLAVASRCKASFNWVYPGAGRYQYAGRTHWKTA
ncbi:P-loop containing nucleoside triphosphate hydrolase protein [Xylariaceae sp. FL1651]|nr:P-loop containing nucleoside triphosphate hydrolase protein [Xylariaceae sp. FL1651]